MKKISEKQLRQLRRVITLDVILGLHRLCPRTLSGKHYWKKVKKSAWGEPKVYFKDRRCSLCDMWEG